MTGSQWLFIAIGLFFVGVATYQLLVAKEEGGILRRFGRWLKRVFDAFLGMS